jgi:hypothetical protein
MSLDFQVSATNPSTVGGAGGNFSFSGTQVMFFPRVVTGGPVPIYNSALSTIQYPNGQTVTPTIFNGAGCLWLPAGIYDGQQFTIQASGTFGSDSGDPSGTVSVRLYANTGTSLTPIYTQIATTGTVTPGYASAEPWTISAVLEGDSKSGLLGGWYTTTVGGALVNSTPKSLDVVLSGLNFQTGGASLPNGLGPTSGIPRGSVLGFLMGVQFGTSSTTNTASLTQFSIS